MTGSPIGSRNTLAEENQNASGTAPRPGMPVASRRAVVPLLAGLCTVVLFTHLGTWQLRRAAFKESIASDYREGAAPVMVTHAETLTEWQRVRLRGEWVTDRTVLLDNRMRNGRAGFEVLTPLKLANEGGIVIVNRGWIAGSGDRSALPTVPASGGPIEITGLAVDPVPSGFSLAAAEQKGPIWQKADMRSFERELHQPVASWLVRQESGTVDTLDRAWQPPDFGADRHRAYAWQWFAMAAAVMAYCIWHATRTLQRRYGGKAV